MGNILLTKTVDSGDDYASAGIIKLPTEYYKVIFQVTEQNVNACKAKILASNHINAAGTALVHPVTLLAETVIAKNGALLTAENKVPVLTDPWVYVDVQYASNVAGTPGTLQIDISGA